MLGTKGKSAGRQRQSRALPKAKTECGAGRGPLMLDAKQLDNLVANGSLRLKAGECAGYRLVVVDATPKRGV